jgi:exodeoxyribonuclease-1
VLPLARHPRVDSRVIVFDLDSEPAALLDLDAEDIADRLYTPAAELPEGETRIALKEVHLNKCPALVAWDHLREADFARLQIDPQEVERRAARLREAGPALAEKVRRVYASERVREPADADASLYDGFIGDGDKRKFAAVRSIPPQALAGHAIQFQDARLPELLFRYRARNWPQTLDPAERLRWDDYRRLRLSHESGLSELGFDGFRTELTALRLTHAGDGGKLALLDQLEAWGRDIEASLR